MVKKRLSIFPEKVVITVYPLVFSLPLEPEVIAGLSSRDSLFLLTIAVTGVLSTAFFFFFFKFLQLCLLLLFIIYFFNADSSEMVINIKFIFLFLFNGGGYCENHAIESRDPSFGKDKTPNFFFVFFW